MKRLVLLAFLACGCQKADDKEVIPPPCSDELSIYNVSGVANWLAVKNGTARVTGHQEVRGTARIEKTKPLSGSLALTISPKPNSGVALRDERIASYVFASTVLRYTAQSVTAQALPNPGETIEATVHGVFEVAGQSIPLDVPALVSYVDPTSLEVFGDFKLDMRQQLGLTQRLADMLALVNATLDDSVQLHVNLDLRENCHL